MLSNMQSDLLCYGIHGDVPLVSKGPLMNVTTLINVIGVTISLHQYLVFNMNIKQKYKYTNTSSALLLVM